MIKPKSAVKIPRVPDCLIRQICYPTTYRLPKLKRLQFPMPTPAVKATATPTLPFAHYQRPSGPTIVPPKTEMGNLPNDQYRFYVGMALVPRSNTMCRCRFCDKYLHSEAERTLHTQRFECKEALIKLYKRLRADGICLCCGERNKKRTTWGIPLCSEECDAVWRVTNPEQFVFERRIYIRGGIEDA